ncbi:hypothetical protein IB238_02240 [Rhizobium sp. ARZ01]|uniref:hypothetical protein n=1 Tax=Rhizobium sp. ARZ01 TaxID=2769313 RepID=UPI00177C443F|nr:hypothetical protein [Rhizobium sp. ARZ01]MBD9371459.1 hypothetical protein [Rhizobium sp. ARZ01]
MKIDSGLLASYAIARQHRPSSDEDGFSESNRGSTVPRDVTPSVAPSMPASSGFASALWLIGVEKDAKAENAAAASADLVAEFMEWSNMSPAERIRAQMLEEMGHSEESLKSLPEAEREAIEDEIRQAIEEQFGIESTVTAPLTGTDGGPTL